MLAPVVAPLRIGILHSETGNDKQAENKISAPVYLPHFGAERATAHAGHLGLGRKKPMQLPTAN
jgi:hypothetical protein